MEIHTSPAYLIDLATVSVVIAPHNLQLALRDPTTKTRTVGTRLTTKVRRRMYLSPRMKINLAALGTMALTTQTLGILWVQSNLIPL